MNDTDPLDDDPYAAPSSPLAGDRGLEGPPTAPLQLRAAAYGINLVLAIATAFGVVLLLLMLPGFQATTKELPRPLEALLTGYIGLTPWCLLNAVLIHRRSQSVGKIVLGLRVVRPDGSPASTARQLGLRWGILALVVLLGGILALPVWVVDKLFVLGATRQALHDRVADTIVVRV